MALSKANVNFKRDWITTATGLIGLIVPILAIVGVISQEQSTAIQAGLSTILTAVAGIIGAVSSIILLFTGNTK